MNKEEGTHKVSDSNKEDLKDSDLKEKLVEEIFSNGRHIRGGIDDLFNARNTQDDDNNK